MLGSLAKHRELQVLEVASHYPYDEFTIERILRELYKGDDRFDLPPIEVIEAYATACRDLKRKQIFKGLASHNGMERFVLNNPETVEQLLKEEQTNEDNA